MHICSSRDFKEKVQGFNLMTMEEAAKYLRISINTLYKNYKDLPYVKIGHSIRIDKIKMDDWIEEQIEKNRKIN